MRKAFIRKSFRLSLEESAEVKRLSQLQGLSETALMKKWIQASIRAEKLELALQAYQQDQVDLRGGAALAGLSYNRFIEEIQQHNIIILDDDGRFLDRLEYLATAFQNENLRRAVAEVRAQTNS